MGDPAKQSASDEKSSDQGSNETQNAPNTRSGASGSQEQTPTATEATNNQIKEPFLECRSLRNANEIQGIAFKRIKQAFGHAQDKEWLNDMGLYEIRQSIRMLVREYNHIVLAHYELLSLAMTKDAMDTQKGFFAEASEMFHATNEVLRNRHFQLAETKKVGEDFIESIDEAPIEEQPLGMELNFFKNQTVNNTVQTEPEAVEELSFDIDDKFTMKTEPIRLPIFNGDKENWVLFREQFITFVHNRKKISNAVKMQQLFAHLSEKALRVIRGITPVASNYERAWKVLNDRYNNNQILINHHLKRFFNLQAITRDDPTRLLSVIDGVNELINSLPGIGEPMLTWDSILIFCVFNKLDHASQEAWKSQCMNQALTLS